MDLGNPFNSLNGREKGCLKLMIFNPFNFLHYFENWDWKARLMEDHINVELLFVS
jgi:hypothetical protein